MVQFGQCSVMYTFFEGLRGKKKGKENNRDSDERYHRQISPPPVTPEQKQKEKEKEERKKANIHQHLTTHKDSNIDRTRPLFFRTQKNERTKKAFP